MQKVGASTSFMEIAAEWARYWWTSNYVEKNAKDLDLMEMLVWLHNLDKAILSSSGLSYLKCKKGGGGFVNLLRLPPSQTGIKAGSWCRVVPQRTT